MHGQAIYVILLRELKRYWRAKGRIVSSLAQGFFFLAVFGLGLGRFVGKFGDANYLSYVSPGVIGMAILFASVLSGISVIFDRQFGFMKEMLIAPVSRTSIVIGKIFGSSVTAVLHGLVLLLVAGLIGAFSPTLALVAGVPLAVGVMFLIAAGFVGLGVTIGSALNDMHSFQLLATFLMWPLFVLSGVFFPVDSSPLWLQIAMFCDPLFYGVELLRGCLLGTMTPLLGPFGWLIALGVLLGFIALTTIISTYLFSRVKV